MTAAFLTGFVLACILIFGWQRWKARKARLKQVE
jgi:predicted negative regulator of RcsB-dependent stress response